MIHIKLYIKCNSSSSKYTIFVCDNARAANRTDEIQDQFWKETKTFNTDRDALLYAAAIVEDTDVQDLLDEYGQDLDPIEILEDQDYGYGAKVVYAVKNSAGNFIFDGDFEYWENLKSEELQEQYEDDLQDQHDYSENKLDKSTAIQQINQILSNVTDIPEKVRRIIQSSKITELKLPNNITSIGVLAFADCTSLKRITIPDSVTSIGLNAFDHCTSLTSITIPNSVTSIGTYAFYNCTSLKSVLIPEGVTEIDSGAFTNCASLASVTIHSRVTNIGHMAFENCISLTSITIPNSVMSIGARAFFNCTSLKNLVVEGDSKLIEIGQSAFKNCRNIKTIIAPKHIVGLIESNIEESRKY